ncbi:hypothetical protein J2Y58_002217 [Sphingomonas sp. BE138]|uniref:hypothetical protein n=1 Tax=Sphingomonas sp. BE138 TaxID=2817845 RepID=UPI002864D206|nr:hypothetical protein [Sphingomonas sp. BE138]MDR6788852.1 hypothetical protein [Sphingomonas sp. BE138]
MINYRPYIPQTLSELMDHVVPMMGDAPKFEDDTGYFSGQNIDTEFHALVEGFGKVRDKIGEDRYAAAIDIAARMKALFLEAADEDDPKTREGILLIHELIDIIDAARARRVKSKLKDDEGRVTGD